MLQEHSFFSRPMTYFGCYQQIEEAEDCEEEEWNFADSWQISANANRPLQQQPRIGLFIHWCDVNE